MQGGLRFGGFQVFAGAVCCFFWALLRVIWEVLIRVVESCLDPPADHLFTFC